MINFNDFKERIANILNDNNIDDVRDIIVGAPYFDKISSAKDKTLYITTRNALIDSITPVGAIGGDNITAKEHELRINLIYITSNADGVRAEILADNVVNRIGDIIDSNSRLIHGSEPLLVQYSYIESIEALEFGNSKTGRLISVKIVIHD